jgi:hypothetical protein
VDRPGDPAAAGRCAAGRAGGWVGGCVFDCLDLLAEWPSILWPCRLSPAPPPRRLCCCTAGIEKYGESWQQVAEHVGGKSAMQCVARFLQLPTEEALLADASPDPHTLGLVSRPAGCLAGWSRGWVWLVRWTGWLVACSCRCSWW